MPSIRFVELNGTEIMQIRPAVLSGSDPIACTQFDLGWAQPRESVHERAGRSGSIDLTQYHGPRTVTFDLRLLSRGGVTKEQTLDKLSEISLPTRCFYIYVRRDGWEEERRMKVRAGNLSCASTRVSAIMFTTALSYLCPSGEMESATETVVLINPPASSVKGLSFPLYWGSDGIWFEPGRSGAQSMVFNNGTVPAPAKLYITGRIDNPIIYNHTTGQKLQFRDTRLANTETLVIDTDIGSVTVGPASFYSKIDWSESSWWDLRPGENDIELSGTNMDENAQLTVAYRSRWV